MRVSFSSVIVETLLWAALSLHGSSSAHPLLHPASGVLFTAFQPHVADALPRSSERSAFQGLTDPRGRRAASLQRAERFSGPHDPTCQTRCFAPASRAFFFLKRSLPHVAVNTKAGPGPGFFIFEFPRLGNHKHVTVFSWAGPYCGLTFLGFPGRETTPHPSQSGARQPGLPP
ncbi:hypothetical protein NDU88_005638 [Pleurodeles waltl]|uniref:Secreted protein n=1 Tax=Pleurodeles waltl TaxID=8319 RepID=A0AAV7UJI9_PLEWA|nr:hypothetical protein NDU88_005638 [Pleurodeles waltl]